MSFSILGFRLKNSKDDIKFGESLNFEHFEKIGSSVCEIIDSKPLDIISIIEEQIANHQLQSVNMIDDNACDIIDRCNKVDICDDAYDEYDTFDEYEIYTKIETHMSISLSLYILNRQGNDILKDLETKKLPVQQKGVPHTPSSDDKHNVGRIYNELHYCINENRLTKDMYTTLISNLDDVLFDECGDMDTFYVKEDEYSLESLYYKQDSWVREIEWDEPQKFEFDKTLEFAEGECMYLLMFANKYMSLLSKIDKEYDNIKLKVSLNKLRDKMRNTQYILSEMINAMISC
jgi:hypothetical protein